MSGLSIGILGAGTMGKQIALLCASKGLDVAMWNHRMVPNFNEDFSAIASLQARLGTITRETVPEILDRVIITDDMSKLSSCEIIIEAVKENIQIKETVISLIGGIISESALIASNTSTLSITNLASFAPNPSRFIGVHFFNPPMSMRLVEVIRGEYTSDTAVVSIDSLLTQLSKQPVILPESPGFVVNRLLFPMINEAIILLSDGIADPKTIDNCMKLGANHPMGPLELADLIGLDICLSILETLVFETGDNKYRPAPLLRKYVRAGKLGKKTGTGFYNYKKRR
jgi:3-hydroxybutyryl-CoA dehydrogenase